MNRITTAARALVLALIAAGCAHSSTVTQTSAGTTVAPSVAEPPNTTGAPTARNAVERFLAGVRGQDFQAMSMIWGNEKGPVRDQMSRAELEKREFIMQCYLAHDKYTIDGERTIQGTQVFEVSLTNGKLTRQTRITAVQGPGSRWYVLSSDLEPLTDFCKQASGKKP